MKREEFDEPQLIAALQQGQAFRQLVETFQKKVYNPALSVLHNAEDAEDLTQEVFMQVYESIGSFRSESRLSTWLYRVATTKALERLRYKKAKRRFGFLLNWRVWHPRRRYAAGATPA